MEHIKTVSAPDSLGNIVSANVYVGVGDNPLYYVECGARSYNTRDEAVAARAARSLLEAELRCRFDPVVTVEKGKYRA